VGFHVEALYCSRESWSCFVEPAQVGRLISSGIDVYQILVGGRGPELAEKRDVQESCEAKEDIKWAEGEATFRAQTDPDWEPYKIDGPKNIVLHVTIPGPSIQQANLLEFLLLAAELTRRSQETNQENQRECGSNDKYRQSTAPKPPYLPVGQPCNSAQQKISFLWRSFIVSDGVFEMSHVKLANPVQKSSMSTAPWQLSFGRHSVIFL